MILLHVHIANATKVTKCHHIPMKQRIKKIQKISVTK